MMQNYTLINNLTFTATKESTLSSQDSSFQILDVKESNRSSDDKSEVDSEKLTLE